VREVRIGTRASRLALAQAGDVMRRLKIAWPSERFRLVKIRTLGDEYQSVELFKKSGAGVFTKAIEKKLLAGDIDIAVHSLKDLPTDLPRGLTLAAVPKRFPVEDVLISRARRNLDSLPKGARVGTGSPRRKRQLLRLRPDLDVVDLRGNLETRISNVLNGRKMDAVVLAAAGLKRLKRFLKYARPLSADRMLPAVGQGALGIETRKNDTFILKLTKRLHDAGTAKEVTAERLFLKTLRGGCRVPVGVRSTAEKGHFILKGAVFSVKSDDFLQAEVRVPLSRYRTAGPLLARRLLKRGAGRFLREARAEGSVS
jgi:hydroxymethylbilane synthase